MGAKTGLHIGNFLTFVFSGYEIIKNPENLKVNCAIFPPGELVVKFILETGHKQKKTKFVWLNSTPEIRFEEV